MKEKGGQKHRSILAAMGVFLGRCGAGLLLALGLLLAFVLEYKADLRQNLEKSIPVTMYFKHKENAVLEVNDQAAVFEEDFLCTVPDLKRLKLHTEKVQVGNDTRMELSLLNLDTGKTCYLREFPASKIRRYIYQMTMDKPLKDSENARMRLKVRLIPGNSGRENRICLTAGQRYGFVEAVNGDENNKTNVIYSMYYGKGTELKSLYLLLCLALLLLAGTAFFLLVICRRTLCQAYMPLALLLGLIMTFVIPVHAVPDEPAHIDTAYTMSNGILGTGSPDREGYSYKRACDAVMQDMMANTLEANHYYQLSKHFLEKPEDTRSIEVVAMDAGRIVPRLVYLPAALGISLGRVMGLSALMTFTLGRMMNLLVYLLLTLLALAFMPYGRNVLALVMLLPITMQQAASASYDAVLNGMLFLFTALCLRAGQKERIPLPYILVLGLFSVFIVLSKGAVYSPLILLLLPVLFRRNSRLPEPAGKDAAMGAKVAGMPGKGTDMPGKDAAVAVEVFGMPGKDTAGVVEDVRNSGEYDGYIRRPRSRQRAGIRKQESSNPTSLQENNLTGRGNSIPVSRQEIPRNHTSRLLFLLVPAALLLMAALFAIKFYPVFQPVLEGNLSADEGLTYTLASLLSQPQKIPYLLWNTFQTQSDYQLFGLLGGNLAWLEISINRIYPIILLICLLLLVHVDGDSFRGGKWQRLLFAVTALCSITLVMLSMLIMFTARTETRIVGPQGRYYLAVFPLLLLAAATPMVHVNRKQLIAIAMTAVVTEIIMVMSAFCLAFVA